MSGVWCFVFGRALQQQVCRAPRRCHITVGLLLAGDRKVKLLVATGFRERAGANTLAGVVVNGNTRAINEVRDSERDMEFDSRYIPPPMWNVLNGHVFGTLPNSAAVVVM